MEDGDVSQLVEEIRKGVSSRDSDVLVYDYYGTHCSVQLEHLTCDSSKFEKVCHGVLAFDTSFEELFENLKQKVDGVRVVRPKLSSYLQSHISGFGNG